MKPISGPWFKARKIHEYNLCLKCFQSSGADKNDFDKIDIGTINLTGRIRRKADRSRNWVSDSAQKNSPNAANDGAGSTAAAVENSGGNSAPLVCRRFPQWLKKAQVPPRQVVLITISSLCMWSSSQDHVVGTEYENAAWRRETLGTNKFHGI
ncbi:unnamed protein product [Calypogeia fissa]